MDTITKEERSRNMSAIRSTNTKPELLIRKWLFSMGYRYRTNVKTIPGHPDLFFRKYNTALFVNGCFWHRHKGCKYAYTPKTRTDFWEEKFKKNITRDNAVRIDLSEKKIKQLIIWECTIKKMSKDVDYREEILQRITVFFKSKEEYLEL